MAPQIALDFYAARAVPPSLKPFHPVVQRWFAERLGKPSRPQVEGWPLIQAGSDVLIAAPTGSGKTLTAFLAALDGLFRQALGGTLPDRTEVLYVSPLKALGNDVQKNLLQPLEELLARARAEGYTPQDLRVQVRAGDTSAFERAQMIRRRPHMYWGGPCAAANCAGRKGNSKCFKMARTPSGAVTYANTRRLPPQLLRTFFAVHVRGQSDASLESLARTLLEVRLSRPEERR